MLFIILVQNAPDVRGLRLHRIVKYCLTGCLKITTLVLVQMLTYGGYWIPLVKNLKHVFTVVPVEKRGN